MSLKSRFFTAFSILSLSAACATTQQGQPTQAGGTSTVEELPNEEHQGGEQPAPEAAPAPAPAAAALPQLNTFGGPEDGFTAKMPGNPPPVVRNKLASKNGEIVTAAWNGNVEGVIYSLSIADYPTKTVAGRAPEAFLNEGRDGIAAQLKGKIVSEENITINDTYPGKAFTIASDSGEVKARTYLVGPRTYTLLTLYNPSIGAPAADEFLRSLTLINPPPRIERKGAAPAGTPAPAGSPAPAPAGSPAPAPATPGTK
ncbi:hypothetical protein [Hyalangium versicolor]|uniref:hypothetical protein n=1 Tax=Hyalangium versicolor TaxID=2861190 RepID=UPI001CCF6369|nr:hypothetical protein [Hyalangium versicolor]